VESEAEAFEKMHQKYLISSFDETLYRASVTTGGWYSKEDEVIHSSESSSHEGRRLNAVRSSDYIIGEDEYTSSSSFGR